MRALIAWPILTSQFLIFGTSAFALSLGAAPEAERERLIESLIGPWRALATIAMLASPLLFAQIAAGMAGTDMIAALPFLPEVLRETHAGSVWEWRLPIAMVLAIGAWLPLGKKLVAGIMLGLSAALLLCESLTSHAIDKGAIAVAVQFFHELAGALWIGAILDLWLGATRARLSDAWVEHTAPWVSRMAEWTVVILLLSGLYAAYRALLGEPALLMYTAYGRVLMIKIAAASLVLLIGAYNRFMLIPEMAVADARGALLRNVAVESILLVGIIGIAALLANTPPAHH